MRKLVKQFQRQMQWDTLDALVDWVVDTAISIQQIPAPTFQEEARANYVAQQYTTLGLTQISLDNQHNVYGLMPGANRQLPAMMIVAHTDTVFAAETDLTIRREDNVIYGPGLGDNSIGVAGLLGLAKMLGAMNGPPACDLWFVATSCEEGLGDLKGIRKAFEHLRERIGLVINLEGLAFGHIYHAGIAVSRLHITAKAEGGHSWLHYGRPSAAHAILELGAQICKLSPPTAPRTTYNIGMIEGGSAINALATQAGLWLDMRSEDQTELERLRGKVLRLIEEAEKPGLTLSHTTVGDRPAGFLNPRHDLVQGALAALEGVNVRGALETGSTDGNIPLQAGCPTVTIGITRGGNAHRLDEYVEIAPVKPGMQQLIVLTLAAAQHQADVYGKAAGD